MQQFKDRHSADLVLRPSEHSRPGGIATSEIAICLKNTEEIRTNLPEATAGDGALGHAPFQVAFRFKVVARVTPELLRKLSLASQAPLPFGPSSQPRL